MTTEIDVQVDISTLPVVKENPKSPRGGRRGDREGLDEAVLEREFKNFAIKLRKQFGEDVVAYQVSNYPEELEFSVRVAKSLGREDASARFTRTFDSNPKTEKKEIVKKKREMTDKQRAKRREYFEKKRQERLENADKDIKGDKLTLSDNEESNDNAIETQPRNPSEKEKNVI